MTRVMRILCLLFLALTTSAAAQDYPSRPITIIVPFSAGGPGDVIARVLGTAMSATLKQSVIIENVVGAGGTLGTNRVAKSAPDGYTVLLMHVGQATAPWLYAKLPFDPVGDFATIGLITDVPMILVARPNFPANDLKELVAKIKADGDKITYGNVGLGSASHLCGLMFMSAVEVDLTTVPYKGTAPAMTDLIGGQVDMLCDQTTNTTQQIKGGKVKALAVTSPKRLETLKDLPTMSESGLPGFTVGIWHAMYAPKGTPKAVIDKLVATLQATLKDPTVVRRHSELGAEVVSTDRATPDALQKHLTAEIARWSPIIKKAGVYAD